MSEKIMFLDTTQSFIIYQLNFYFLIQTALLETKTTQTNRINTMVLQIKTFSVKFVSSVAKFNFNAVSYVHVFILNS